jgi:nucleoside-diphosphate-sugar epimerase|tara:strand:- start:2556 stop:3488 length:933 start_codon:yes stop_codon:yes gene_type:complete
MERKNAIISGGAGFVGGHLSTRLLKEGFDTIYLIDNLVRTESLRNIKDNPKIKFLYGDVSTFDFSIIKNVTHFFHLAATRINRCAHNNKEGHNYIASGGFNVIDYCAKNNIKLFFSSTASVYNKPKRQPIQEEDPCTPHTIYGAGKYYTENLIRSYDNMLGFNYTINRFFSVYGVGMDCEGAYTEVIFNWLSNIKNGVKDIKVFGNPDEKILDLVYIDDVIDAIILTTFNSNKEVFNVSTQNGVTLTGLINTIENVTNTKLNIDIVPENRTDIENKRVGDTSKLKQLGWKDNINLTNGIKKTYDWITKME